MEKEQLRLQKKAEEQRFLRETQLFETKWRILEEEYARLAKEKQEFEAKRSAQKSKKTQGSVKQRDASFRSEELFFSGVSSELGMKKRYKDLIKIFHPDNSDGDTRILQKINQEYDEMKRIFSV